MSINYILHSPKDDRSIRITENYFYNKIHDALILRKFTKDQQTQLITYFSIAKTIKDLSPCEFSMQDDGNYWAFTNDYYPENFDKFIWIIAEVARLLGLQIDDPQTGEINMSHSDFLAKDHQVTLQSGLDDMVSDLRDTSPKIQTTVPVDQQLRHPKELRDYDEHQADLEKKYESESFCIAGIMWTEKVTGETDYFAILMAAQPTILPPVKQILVSFSARRDAPLYRVSMDTLLSAANEYVSYANVPVNHYIVRPITTGPIIDKIKENAKLISV
jgi:hypothetical protein